MSNFKTGSSNNTITTQTGATCRIIRAHSGETWEKNGGGSLELKYWVIGEASQQEAMNACWEDALDKIGGFEKKTIRFDGYDDERNAEFTVVYQRAKGTQLDENGNEPEPTVSFSCGGGVRHVTYANVQRRFGNDNTFNVGTGINWNGEAGANAAFNGVDVPSVSLQETYTKVMKVADAKNISFRRKVANLVGCANKNTFKGWEPGEALFTGCSFSGVDKSGEYVTVNFNFSIKLNEPSAEIDGIKLGMVRGWQYVWAVRPKAASSGTGIQLKTQTVYVADVVRYESFAPLGL